MSIPTASDALRPSERFRMAVEEIQQRLERIAKAFTKAKIPFALIGGQAVALWVGSVDKSATRVTKDVDILLRREDLDRASAAAATVGMEYVRTYGVDMFIEKVNPSPKSSVHIIWAGEKVRAKDDVPSPSIEPVVMIEPERPVVPLETLVAMKLTAHRDHDRTHLRDMIDVGLIDESMADRLPVPLGLRLRQLFEQIQREREEDSAN